ncbi:hypothetical protein HEK616_26610 [Streptomyces nigrescens]|uniref:Uncharacterized protein n=1 Tax=Streptomyces nigrescens TaxID=1920 RepID=A0ABM7ZSF3_STRNI|nr:hypothetical protein HEK616_26610 [Streptomyces nigrescens]
MVPGAAGVLTPPEHRTPNRRPRTKEGPRIVMRILGILSHAREAPGFLARSAARRRNFSAAGPRAPHAAEAAR